MPRRFRFPAYPAKPHKSGQARIKIRGRDYYLGVWGSDASRKEYARLAAEFAADPCAVALPCRPEELTVDGLIAAWAKGIEAEGEKSAREIGEVKRALAVVSRLYGHTPADAFDAQRLEVARAAMTSGSWMTTEERALRERLKKPIGWARRQTNKMVCRARGVWRWAERHRLVSRGAWEHLRTLAGLRKGNRKVRHSPDRTPASWEQVQAILGAVPAPVSAMILVQWWTGMRPSEVVAMQVGAIDQAAIEGIWLYRLGHHKSDWREGHHGDTVTLGPEAQKALAPWLEAARIRGPQAYLFIPQRTKRAICYTTEAYARAVALACERTGTPRWSPYQLRHAAKQRLTRTLGLDAARAQLRQASLDTTNSYARQHDLTLAAEAARKTG